VENGEVILARCVCVGLYPFPCSGLSSHPSSGLPRFTRQPELSDQIKGSPQIESALSWDTFFPAHRYIYIYSSYSLPWLPSSSVCLCHDSLLFGSTSVCVSVFYGRQRRRPCPCLCPLPQAHPQQQLPVSQLQLQ
jgi:hypothetical protein